MKYKVMGWLDLILGGLSFVQQAIMLFLVYPKMNVLYEGFGADLPFFTKVYPYTTGILILVLAGVVWIGWKLAFSKVPDKKLFKAGVIALIFIILGWGYYFGSSIMSLIYPIYDISNY